jgi:hypothetical protein
MNSSDTPSVTNRRLFRGGASWKPANATVYSSEWLSKPAHTDGHHHIVYNYTVGGEYYSGEFFQYGFETDAFLKPGDRFEIRYVINNPAKSYYPELRTGRKAALISFAIGAGIALVMGALAIYNNGTH